jgi:small subunit ribosomal protein S11
MKKRKEQKVVETGRVYITATFNNTLVTITDQNGAVVLTSSCGAHGFSGTRKSTPYAATITVDAAVKKAQTDHQLREVVVFVKGIGPGREASLRVLRGSSLDIDKVVDVTPVPHNGVRPPKIRRI